jgi:HAD superfamily hydrolase (TIGR01549 family)
MSIAAVTFDFWNTLVYEERGHLRGRRLDAWAGILEDTGFAVERERLDLAFDVSWERFVGRWEAGEQYQAVQAAEEIVEELGFAVPAEVREQLVDAFTRAGEDAELHLTEGVADTLRSLKAADLRLGIICDVGMTASPLLRAHLDRHGVLELFDHWSFSDEVGAYKPDPSIFEHALAGLGGMPPERVAHVGDLRRTDVAGALGMGMIAVRYTGVFDDDTVPEPEAHHVVGHHARLPGVLGLAA